MASHAKKSYIKKLIEQGENQQLDFKFAVNDSRKIARSIVAFANTDGGRLLIGVKDNGVIAGINSIEELHMIETAAHIFSRPQIDFKSLEWNIEGKIILEITIQQGPKRPYYAQDEFNHWNAWIRQYDRDIKAPKIWIEYWKRKSSGEMTTLSYGPTEKFFLQMLEKQGLVNIESFRRLLGISTHYANEMALQLLLMDIIGIRFEDDKPFFYLKNGSSSL
ncbi:MAG: Putative transcriptional regulator [Bacteroidetes bacterium 38_7]|nr:MAG: Putative transcriptional regulator [Bacteroidetes bacterium 38_7]HAL64309.1 ATP-binding protein [Bacteroidales bacterium]